MIKGYSNGKQSNLGYLCFRDYVVNLDTGLPDPFFELEYEGKW